MSFALPDETYTIGWSKKSSGSYLLTLAKNDT